MPRPMPRPRPTPGFVLEFSPESLGEDEREGVGTDEEWEEVGTGDEDEEVGTDDEEGVPGDVEAADSRRILKWPLLNLCVVSPGL